jgi:N-acetylglutamate synthase-like GNAT family acetyltransferase
VSQITVRTAHRQDLTKILEIMSGAYSARGYCSHSRAEQYLDNNKFALVAEKNQEIVGTMLVTYDEGNIPADEDFAEEMRNIRRGATKIAYYGSFAVKVGMWKLGILSIGLALVREAIARALDDGIETAVIVVNPRHQEFYAALGFVEIARREEMPGLGVEGKVPGVLMTVTRETFRDVLRQKADLRVYRTQNTAVAHAHA